MSSSEFFPYAVQRHLTLVCKPQGLSQVLAPGTIDLREVMEAGETLPSIDLEVSIFTEDALLDLLPASERDDPEVGVGVLVTSIPSRIRELIRLDQSGSTDWKGTLTLESDQVFNFATLEPVMFRLEDSTDQNSQGKATHKSARIGWGPAVRVLFDHFAEPGSHWLRMEWVDFSAEPSLADHKDLLFLVDVDAPGQLPVLRLNESIDSLKEVLMAPNRNSHLKRIRDAIGSAIALQAGTQMSLHVTSRIFATASSDSDSGPEEILDDLREWEQGIVRFWSQRIFADTSGVAELKFVEHASDPVLLTELNAKLGIESQRLADLRGSFGGLNVVKEKLGA